MTSLRIIAVRKGDSSSLGKKQKRFNTLVKTANDLRAALRAWRDADYELPRRSAAVDALIEQQRHVVRQLVVLFDGHAQDATFSALDRKQLAMLAVEYARDLLAARADDAEIKVIYNRLAKTDYDIERAEDEAYQSSLMQSILEEHGLELDGQFTTLGELEAAARAKQVEREEAAAARRARRKKSAKQVAAEERRAVEEVQAGKALQEVYRQLVRSLHPDHERDDAERARKTALMQDVNVAYERDDLLALLELQLRVEQIDSAHVGGLAEERLDRFIKLLDDQIAQLRDEVAAVEHPFRVQLEVFPPRKLPVTFVLASMAEDADHLAQRLAHLRNDLHTLADRTRMKAWLKDMRARRSRDAREFSEMIAMLGSMQPRRR